MRSNFRSLLISLVYYYFYRLAFVYSWSSVTADRISFFFFLHFCTFDRNSIFFTIFISLIYLIWFKILFLLLFVCFVLFFVFVLTLVLMILLSMDPVIYIYFALLKIFTFNSCEFSPLANGPSLEFRWQQVFSSLLVSSSYLTNLINALVQMLSVRVFN